MATGRSVLVVSKGEAALDVLRDQIPEEIRKLTISMLTTERQGLRQLEEAVTFMANQVVDIDVVRINRVRLEKENEIVELKSELKRLETEIFRWAKKQLDYVPESLGLDAKLTPAELARIISSNRQRYEWLPDDLGPTAEFAPQFTQQQLTELNGARNRLGADLKYLGTRIPHPNDLPDVEQIVNAHADLLHAASIASLTSEQNLPSVAATGEDIHQVMDRLKASLSSLRDVLLQIDGGHGSNASTRNRSSMDWRQRAQHLFEKSSLK